MRTLCKNRNWKLLVLASSVLIFMGYQFFWYLTADNFVLLAVSIVINIILLVMLFYKDEFWKYLQKNNMSNNACCETTSLNSKNVYNEEIMEHLVNIKGELNQVEQLVNDAVINLIVNFKYLSELTKSQQDLVFSIEKMAMTAENTELVKLLWRQMMIMKKIEQELASTAISMQFGDMVTQLLQHATKQINTLDSILIRFYQEDNQKGSTHKPKENHNGMPNNTKKIKMKNQTKTVSQQSLQSGEIELF